MTFDRNIHSTYGYFAPTVPAMSELALTELVVVCGVGAGVLSTLAGQGGGLVALLALSAAVGPKEALVLTAPGLAVANVHRAWMCRREIDRAIVRRMFAPIVVASAVVGTLAVRAPTGLLRALLVVATVIALAKALGWLRFSVRPSWFAPAGAAIGAFGACSGGAGLLLSPLLVSAGLEGEAFIGTTQALALALNGGRMVGYFAGGSLTASVLPLATAMLLALLVGNSVGHSIRRWLGKKQLRAIELGTMALATTLVALGARG